MFYSFINVYSCIMYVIPPYIQASVQQMEKCLPGISFHRLATDSMATCSASSAYRKHRVRCVKGFRCSSLVFLVPFSLVFVFLEKKKKNDGNFFVNFLQTRLMSNCFDCYFVETEVWK